MAESPGGRKNLRVFNLAGSYRYQSRGYYVSLLAEARGHKVIPGVKTIRAISMFGFSTAYVIFDEDVDFYWSRTRVLEKLSSLAPGTLPDGVRPTLGPDATPLGQVFWYTLEGRDADTGEPVGGCEPPPAGMDSRSVEQIVQDVIRGLRAGRR